MKKFISRDIQAELERNLSTIQNKNQTSNNILIQDHVGEKRI